MLNRMDYLLVLLDGSEATYLGLSAVHMFSVAQSYLARAG